MRTIRYDQQSIEDCARSVLRMETQLDASLCNLSRQIDALEVISGTGSSAPLIAATKELRRLKKLIAEKEEDLARLRSGLRRVMDIFDETELKLKRDFSDTAGAKPLGSDSDAKAYTDDQSSDKDVNTLVDSLFFAIQSVASHSTTDVVANDGAFEWISTDFNGCGVTALEGMKRVAVASIAPNLNTVGSFYDVIAPEWMMELN